MARIDPIDPTKTWRKVEERLARETDPRRCQLLRNVLAHMKAEAAGDLAGLMATLAPDGFANLRTLAPDELPPALVDA